MIKRISVRFNTDFKEDKELLETLETVSYTHLRAHET